MNSIMVTYYDKLKSFTVKRDKWTGLDQYDLDYNSSSLLNDDRRQCCLGFYASACGIPDSDIIDLGTPADLANHRAIHLCGFVEECQTIGPNYMNSDIAVSMIRINDSYSMGQKRKEEKLIELFKSIDIELKFE